MSEAETSRKWGPVPISTNLYPRQQFASGAAAVHANKKDEKKRYAMGMDGLGLDGSRCYWDVAASVAPR